MNRLAVPTPPAVAPDRPQQTDTHLRGRRLLLARAAWLAVAAVALALFVAGIPAEFAQLVLCPSSGNCPPQDGVGQLLPAGLHALHDLGLSLRFFAAYAVALDVMVAVVYSAVAALIFWHKSAERMALFAALALLTFATATFTENLYALAAAHSSWWPPIAALNFLGAASFGLFLYVFPDGRFVPRWTRWVALAWLVWQAPKYWIPNWPALTSLTIRFDMVVWLVALITVVYAQVYRYRRVSNAVQRQQTKWVVFGIAAALVGYMSINLVLDVVAPAPTSASAFAILMAGFTLIYLAMLIIPLSIGVAMLRHHLFDVDVLINRTLVYGALTVCVVGLYVLIVGSLGALFQAGGNLVISLVATGLVAVLFQPLRDRLQHGVNHLLYGERDEPYIVLARLGQRLEGTLAPDAVLPTIVETIAQALKLPYAAIALDQDGQCVTTIAVGTPVAEVLHLPLVYQGASIGQFVLGPRAPGEPLSAADQRLLSDLAHQVAVAAHAVRLTAELQQVALDLQRSRERLVVAREEERRRLRRDLHDGLGPTLAALALSASAISDLISANPTAAALAKQLEVDIRTTVGEIRRLIHGLRPPALDELGLAGAVRDRAAQLTSHQHSSAVPSLRVTVDAPEHLPPLPAAVEVAAFRIMEEALTNVARHAQARMCAVRLALTDVLEVEIADDGIGIPAERRAGVGLLSMRERAAELGGACVIEALGEVGTRVYAQIPLPKE
ncbi:MAG TPA: histidine kinase [Roseiflexaceae bacterium]|nr:histidine kinase [Roseiflexaceae bacterium]